MPDAHGFEEPGSLLIARHDRAFELVRTKPKPFKGLRYVNGKFSRFQQGKGKGGFAEIAKPKAASRLPCDPRRQRHDFPTAGGRVRSRERRFDDL